MAELPRLNGIIRALEEGNVAFVGSGSARDPQAVLGAPFDGVLFDQEHSPYDIHGLQDALQYLLNRHAPARGQPGGGHWPAGSCRELVPRHQPGRVGVSALPDGLRSKEAFIVLQEEFGFGQDLPAVVVIDGRANSEAVEVAIDRVEAALAADPAFATTELEVHPEANPLHPPHAAGGGPS